MYPVSGQKDPIVVLARSLATPKGRRTANKYLIEGAEIIRRFSKWGAKIEALLISSTFAKTEEGKALAAEVEARSYTLSQGLLQKVLTAVKPPPKVIAIAAKPEISLEDFMQWETAPLYLALDAADSQDNLGIMLRSAEASGVDGVFMGPGSCDPWGWRVVRGSRGALAGLKLFQSDDLADLCTKLKAQGVQIVATSANTDERYDEVDYSKPTVIIIGNEHHGVSQEVLDTATACVKIPMLGNVNSLNIAVAGSVMLYEAQRQRKAP